MRDREEDRMTVEWAGTSDAFPSKFHRRVATRHDAATLSYRGHDIVEELW